MLHILLATFDAKTGIYSKPVAVPTEASGVRAFADAVNDPNTEFAKHPEDYSIWMIGTYNDNTCEFSGDKPVHLASAVALVKNFE